MVRDNMIVGCSLDQSEISSPCHQDVEIWKTYDFYTDTLTYTTSALIYELHGEHTKTITANSDQDDAEYVLADDGDYWTATEDISGSASGYELEIEFDPEMCMGGFHIRNGWSMPTFPVETTFEFYVTGDTSTPSYTFTDYL